MDLTGNYHGLCWKLGRPYLRDRPLDMPVKNDLS